MGARTSSIAEQACAGQLPLRELLFHPLRGALSSYFVFFAFFFTLVFLRFFCHKKCPNINHVFRHIYSRSWKFPGCSHAANYIIKWRIEDLELEAPDLDGLELPTYVLRECGALSIAISISISIAIIIRIATITVTITSSSSSPPSHGVKFITHTRRC